MTREVNFTRVSRRDIEDQKNAVREAITNNNVGIVDRNVNRKDIVEVKDSVFFNLVMMIFENNDKANSCFFSDFKDSSTSDLSVSTNIKIDPYNTCLRLYPGAKRGEYFTRQISSEYSKEALLNDFYLVVDEYLPPKCYADYFIVTDKGESFPIVGNNKVPLSILDKDSMPKSVRVKAVLKQNAGENDLKINGIALLYNDSYVGKQIDVFNPEFGIDLLETDEDTIELFRDPNNEDALFKVESSNDKILLNYNRDSELVAIDVLDKKTNAIKSKVEMIYDEYIGKSGVPERLLSKVRSTNSLSLSTRR